MRELVLRTEDLPEQRRTELLAKLDRLEDLYPKKPVTSQMLQDPGYALRWVEDTRISHRDRLAVIQHYVCTTEHRRTRAWWAHMLASHHPECEALSMELRYWALEDPAPFAGGWYWKVFLEDGTVTGGAKYLLERTCDHQADWVCDGLKRLWAILMELPWFISRPKAPELLTRGWLEVGRDFVTEPLKTIADTLVARGHQDIVVETWLRPPDEPAVCSGDGGGLEPRADVINRTLRMYGFRHARAEDLRARLDAWLQDHDARALPYGETVTLLDRGESNLGVYAEAIAEHLGDMTPLIRANPSRCIPALQSRLSRQADQVREDLAVAMQGFSQPGRRHLHGLWESRKLAWGLDEVHVDSSD